MPPLIGNGSTAERRRTIRASRGVRSTARAIAARSPAHEWLPASRIPLGVENRVQASPIACARWFISRTNRRTLPPAARWASAIAASLPETSSSPWSIVCTPISLPRGSSPTPEP